LFYGDDQNQVFDIGYDGKCLEVRNTKYDIQLTDNKKEFQMHIFLDRSLFEIFVNNGTRYISSIVEVGIGFPKLKIFAKQGVAGVNSLDVWEITK
jgi:sucrose-6-phosphate hydrolase SacC (GH32 family)